VVGTIYGALGAMQAAQVAFNQVYGVPRNEQPNPVKSRIRSLGLIALLGTAVLLSTGIASIVSTAGDVLQQLGLHHYRIEVTFGGYVLAFVLNSALFTAAFELLTARDLRIHNTITGGLLAGGLWELLQVFGSRYVTHEVNHSGSLYGLFGVVLALIAWIYLQALALMLAAEVNVVLHHRLWPRALLTPFTDDVELTDADRRAYHMYAMVQRFKGFERVDTDFAKSAASSARGSGSAAESSSAVGATRALEPYPEEPRPQPARVPAETPRS
jgi:uncharacterized BrkB/YihY/UPF0761 family membrane protein